MGGSRQSYMLRGLVANYFGLILFVIKAVNGIATSEDFGSLAPSQDNGAAA
jgi:hypothetical protein